ncbi:metallophosphoesterase [Gracilibacillus sp. YIM 98692]|uniref:metallophosphoesterase n=1 Tax=Gracilibacillus sp. YIM 98692 TaxID=2663532 RepID=UPI0013D1C21D|nr:metallophosphoesterase [Gracilibacillus sp. YIM 98692]
MTYIILAIAIMFISYFFIKGYKNTKLVNIEHKKIENSNLNVPLSWFRVLQLSDLHLENISITPNQLYQELKDQQIDLIAITGDLLDRKKTIPKLASYLEALQKLNPVHGIYVVFGNHDYVLREDDLDQLKALLHEYGCKLLINEHETIEVNGGYMNIIGIDDYSTNHSNIEKSYDGVDKGYRLVLTHDPNIVLSMSDYPFDYLLSGHFHGGQIHWPKPFHLLKMGKLVRMNVVQGLHYQDGKPFYISEGLGQTGVNIRIGSRPEITFHDIQLEVEEKEVKKDTTKAG